ncbi:MAG: N-acetyl-gamma-glutamyl-phosphate reductase [Planctomycetes bacterium]|nr:N-acetyl-gamma-glutamyl-phosphate reductase [Planctomycetota bacterium]
MTHGIAKRRVAVVGASGFTGKEALRLLAQHPHVEVTGVYSARSGEASAAETYAGALREPVSASLDLDALGTNDAVLLCAPHEASATLVPQLLESVPLVLDLSAAYRLRDAAMYPRFYGFEHPAPDLLEERVYGLTEFAREELRNTRLVACPGCYVTSVLLPLLALRDAGLLTDDDVIADCKSGVSGAGKAATGVTHFASVHEDFRAYGVGTHRHEPEIREQFASDRVYFTPHLLPIFRGILSTLHLRADGDANSVREALRTRFEGEPFVSVLDKGLPAVSEAQTSNRCVLGVASHGDRIVVVSCIDNLVKGASGQAIQNLNVALDLPETAGLEPVHAAIPGWR